MRAPNAGYTRGLVVPKVSKLIRSATTNDAAQICDIYNHYILETPTTFEEQPVSVDEMVQRIEDTMRIFPWLVWEEELRLMGYCYASKWKSRAAYRFAVESSVYLHPLAVGKGIGSQLFDALLSKLRQQEVHTVIGGVALPNPASIALLEKFGFEKVAQFKQVGNKFNQWIDVGYWQVFL